MDKSQLFNNILLSLFLWMSKYKKINLQQIYLNSKNRSFKTAEIHCTNYNSVVYKVMTKKGFISI